VTLPLFEQCFAIVVGIEGRLSLDPRDPGNWCNGKLVGTKYGVAAKYHPGVDIPNLSLEGAHGIHLAEYWRPAGCDLLPPRAALCAYDGAVNQGVPETIELLQQATGQAVDGALGPHTRAAFAAFTLPQLQRFMGLRALRYAHTRNFEVDGLGWLTRLFTVSLAPLVA
jgi:lysozyme family protein